MNTWRARWRGLRSAVAPDGACRGAGLGCGPKTYRTAAYICHADTAGAVLFVVDSEDVD